MQRVLSQRAMVERRLRDHREEARWQLARANGWVDRVRGGAGGRAGQEPELAPERPRAWGWGRAAGGFRRGGRSRRRRAQGGADRHAVKPAGPLLSPLAAFAFCLVPT
jgi:hypothetical protein